MHAGEGGGAEAVDQREKRRHQAVHPAVGGGLRLHADGLDKGGAEIVYLRKAAFEQRVFSGAAHPRPHGFALLAAVGTRAGDIDEMQLRVVRQQRIGHRQRHVVGKGAVIGFVHAAGGNADAVKAAVKIAQLRQLGLGTAQIGGDNLPQFGVLLRQRLAHDHRHFADIIRLQSLPQHALPHHAAGTENHHFHWVPLLNACFMLEFAVLIYLRPSEKQSVVSDGLVNQKYIKITGKT